MGSPEADPEMKILIGVIHLGSALSSPIRERKEGGSYKAEQGQFQVVPPLA